MVRRLTLVAGLLAISTSQAGAEMKVGSTPSVGVEATATIGSPVFERFRYAMTMVAVPDAPMIKGVLTGDIAIREGEPLYPTSSKAKLKACSTRGPCALDDDGDGNFDRIALDDTVHAFKLSAPAPYKMREVTMTNPDGNFKQVVTYLGVANGDLRLSYREFMNDFARPALTEELTIPLEKSYPQTIAFKDVKMTVLSLDGASLRYRID